MGSGATKPQAYEKLVYETRQDGATFTSNEDDTVLLSQNTATPWQSNCIFAKDPLHLSTGIQLRLTVKGAGIVRFGFATKDPKHSIDFIKSSILEHEDGFERCNNVRIIAVDAFSFVTYADEEESMKKDLTEIAENVKAWLYVIVLQGCPLISIKKDNIPLELKTLYGSNITIKSNEAVPRKTLSSGVCRLEKPVSVDLTYCINWQMKLEGNDFDDNVTNRKYGFFRFGFVTAVSKSLNQLSLYSGQMDGEDTWFVESAVSSYLYSEMITFTINQEAGTISHNLALASAKRFVTEKFPLDCTKPLYLVLEVFHGDVCSVQKYPPKQAPKPEFPGHILLFKNFRPARSVPEHIQIGVKFKTEPCRIQYGTDPTMVLAEFRKRFQDRSLKQLLGRQSLPWDSQTEIGESSKIQVLDIPDNITAEDLETFFSNKSACGGGKVKRVENLDYIPGCWVIEYEDKSDAREVWQERNHRLITSMVTVLPYYDQLGPTDNYGLKPEFDRSNLMIVIENEKKMSYLTTVAKKCFEQHIEKLNLSVIWPSVNQPEFEDDGLLGDTIDERTCIVLECNIPVNQYQKLVSWKEKGRKAVAMFLAEVQICEIVVAKEVWEEALSLLNREKKANDFVFDVNKSQRMIEIISSNQSRLFDLKNMIQNLKAPEEQVFEKFNVDVFKYKSLDNAGLLTQLESSNPKTSSTLDTKNHLLILKGPISEVGNMKARILNLLVDTELIAVKQTKERISILKCSEGRKALQQKLRERKLTEHFEIRDSMCEICVYCGTKYTVKQAEKTLSECLDSVLKEEKYNVPDDLLETLQSGKDLETTIRDLELLNNNTFRISVDGKVITCTGISSMVKFVIEDIKQYLQENKMNESIVYFQRNIVNYIETFNQNYGFHNCTFLKNEDGMLTGEIVIKDKAEKVTQTKQAIQTATEHINTFWFYLQRPWLSNAIMSLDTLHSLALKRKCLLQPEIGETLAQAGVSAIAVSVDGTAVQIINCNITDQDTDVIVNAANETLHMTEGLSKAISDAAGLKIQDECTKYTETKGRLFEGRAVFTNAGNLKCREILHVLGPMWKNGKDNEKNILQTAIISALNMVNKKKYLSVMIPAIGCGVFGYPNDLAADHIVEAVDMFVSKNPNSTVKEIYLCDKKQEMVTLFEKAMRKVLKKPWFIFEHKRPLTTVLPNTDVNRSDERLRFDKTSRPGQRNDILGISLRWGRTTKAPNRGIPQMLASHDRSDRQTDRGVKRKQQGPKFQLSDILEESGSEFNVLPMSIDLTSRTKLTVVKGTIENQQLDVIVCTSPQFPDIVGAVANAILRKGGETIKSECRKRGKLQHGDVICTGKGTLPCKKLFHVKTLTDWGNSTGPKNVRQIVGPCLKEADKKGYVSIAFPVIGIGACHYPADRVAEVMTKSILEYMETNTDTIIQEVRIVIYERDSVTVQTFEDVIPKLLVPSGLFAEANDADPLNMKKEDNTAVVSKNPNFSDTRRVKTLRVKYVEPDTVESHSEADDVVLIQVTTAGTTLKEIKQKAEELLDIDFLTNTIDFKTLTDEQTLNDEEVKRLMQLNTTEVKIDIDQKATKVTISGLRAAVKKADNDACNLLKTEFPQRRKQKKIESLIADLVQWQVSDGKKACEKVSAEVNFELEMNYDKGVDFKYQNKGVEYRVLIQSLEEHPVNKPQMKRKLYRRIRYGKDTEIRLPDIWSISGTAEDYNEFEIPANDPLFNKVKKKFWDAGCKPMTVNKIIRIENRTLYLQYELMKKKIQIRNPTGIQNERELWHGSDKATISLICQKGFDRSFAGRNATHYGEGVYFANDSAYSHNFAAVGRNRLNRMILAKVLTGEYTLGKTFMKAPPNKNNDVLYDSLVDNVNNPSIFVIFHDTQAYPQYVIEYA